ncbi:MAG: hypothetical protein F4W97_05615 [Chloroflexi bacterium]|nr:hypothetical protein [Chloroflexota bacterium]
MRLFDSLSQISEQIKRQRHLITSEQATILISIQPFIRALGYDTQNLAEVQPEYTADPHSSGTERVDYVIKRDGKPIMLIEVKSVNTTLNQHHWKQLHSYFVSLDVEFGVLTNGLDYRFYTDTKKSNVMDEDPFLTIDLLKLDASKINTLEEFSKSRFAPEQTLRKLKISNLLEIELNEPSDDFVKHFAKQVHSGPIYQSVIQEFRPLVKRAWDDLVDQEIARRLRRRDDEHEDGEDSVQLDLGNIEQNGDTSPLPNDDKLEVTVHAKYKGHRFEADLLYFADNWKQSRILVGGEIFKPSPSTLEVMKTVTPSKKSMANGWSFWKLRDPDGNQERPIGDLRKDTALLQRLQGNS